jgi:hypothetical protein
MDASETANLGSLSFAWRLIRGACNSSVTRPTDHFVAQLLQTHIESDRKFVRIHEPTHTRIESRELRLRSLSNNIQRFSFGSWYAAR